MKTLITLAILSLLHNYCKAQSENQSIQYLSRLNYTDCNLTPFTWEDGSHKISFATGNNKLTNYFIENISNKRRLFFYGRIGIQILLNNQGKSCCKSIYLKDGKVVLEDFKLLNLDSIINTMPNWTIKKPALADSNGGNYCLILEVEFYGDGNISVTYDPYARRKFIN